MNEFTEIKPEETENAIKLIGGDWMLITAGTSDDYNTMTASWGMLGVLWNKPVCTCFVRPQRFTHEFIEKNDYITFSFFDEEYRKALRYCGSHSGRECDKANECGFTVVQAADGKAVYFDESKLVLVCRKLYSDEIKEDCFADKSLLANYSEKDYHSIYVCEIIKAIARR